MIFLDTCEHCDKKIGFGPEEWVHAHNGSFMCNWDDEVRDFSQPTATPVKVDASNVDLVYAELDKLNL